MYELYNKREGNGSILLPYLTVYIIYYSFKCGQYFKIKSNHFEKLMRQPFNPQLQFGQVPIENIRIDLKSRAKMQIV